MDPSAAFPVLDRIQAGEDWRAGGTLRRIKAQLRMLPLRNVRSDRRLLGEAAREETHPSPNPLISRALVPGRSIRRNGLDPIMTSAHALTDSASPILPPQIKQKVQAIAPMHAADWHHV
jgi:hypothetical protein